MHLLPVPEVLVLVGVVVLVDFVEVVVPAFVVVVVVAAKHCE